MDWVAPPPWNIHKIALFSKKQAKLTHFCQESGHFLAEITEI